MIHNTRGIALLDIHRHWHPEPLLLALKWSLLIVLLLALGNRGFLVLLVFGDQVVHVGLSLSEFHLVHALTSVPVQESLATEHGSELITDTLEELLDGGAVADEGRRHLETSWWNGAEGSLDVVGDPFNEVGSVLVLDVADLVLNLLHGDLTPVDGRAGEVTAVAEVAGSHHVLGVEDLLGKLWHSDGTEMVSTTAGQRSETDHEEVQTWEWNHVDSKLSKIAVELTRETQASGDTGHDGRDQVVQVAVRWVVELQSAHADIVQRLVVDTEGLVRVLDELVDGQGGIVWLDDSVGDLWRWHDGEGSHHAVWKLLANLADEKRTHTGTSTTTKGVGDLETLEAIAALSLTTDNVEDLVDELGTLSVVTLGPVVSGTGLAEDEVVGAEKLTERTSTDSIHGTWLQIDEDGTWDVLVARSLVKVDVHALKLHVGGAIVDSSAIKAMLARDVLPEGCAYLVATLAGLKVDDLAHCGNFGGVVSV